MKKIILFTGLLNIIAAVAFSQEKTTFVAKFSLKFIDGDKVLTSTKAEDKAEMIKLITEGVKFKNYQYALRAALVSTAELQNDKNLHQGLQLLEDKKDLRIGSFEVNVVKTKDNDAKCSVILTNYTRMNRWTYLTMDCYGINGHEIAASIQLDLNKSRLLQPLDKEALEKAFLTFDDFVNIKP